MDMMSVFGGIGMLVSMAFWVGLLALLLWALAGVIRGEREYEKARGLLEKAVRGGRTR